MFNYLNYKKIHIKEIDWKKYSKIFLTLALGSKIMSFTFSLCFLYFPSILNDHALVSFCLCGLIIHTNILFKRIRDIQHLAVGMFPGADG